MAAAIGAQAKLGLGSTSTVNQPLEFISENIALTENFLGGEGIVGSRSDPSERTARGTRMVQGAIVCRPTPLELDYLLPKILGTAKSGDLIALAETLPDFYIAVDRVTKVPVYGTCTVASATFQASEGGPLTVTMNVMGQDETVGNSGTFPSISIDLTGTCYMMQQAALTIGGTTYQFKEFSLTVDNQLETEYFNSATPTRFNPTGRIVTWSLSLPYGDAAAVYASALAGVACVCTFTNSTRSLSFSSSKVQTPRQSPTVQGRGEIMLPWTGIARKDGSTLELVTNNDSTV